jgi:hypothetical protein
MDENDWYDEDDDYSPAPYVVIEKGEIGIGPFLLGIALGAGAALLFAPQSGQESPAGHTPNTISAVPSTASTGARLSALRLLALGSCRSCMHTRLPAQPNL